MSTIALETTARDQSLLGCTFEHWLDRALEDIRAMLMAKNAAYGNSALDPVRLFARSDAVEQIKVRIDDKISRLVRGHEAFGDNTASDFLGYLVLLRIGEMLEKEGR
jgi:hypothetical protein